MKWTHSTKGEMFIRKTMFQVWSHVGIYGWFYCIFHGKCKFSRKWTSRVKHQGPVKVTHLLILVSLRLWFGNARLVKKNVFAENSYDPGKLHIWVLNIFFNRTTLSGVAFEGKWTFQKYNFFAFQCVGSNFQKITFSTLFFFIFD